MRRWAMLVGAWMLVAVPAAADVSAQDRVVARALFDEGRKLAQKGNYADACPKFEESQRIDPGVGTQFNLADCYEHTGRTATAWMLYLDVASQSKKEGQADREKVARKRASALEPKLSKLSIVVTDSKVPGIEVRRDGDVVGQPVWGQPIPVDPGAHKIQVTAPGKKTYMATVTVGPNAASETVTIPALEAEAAAPPPVTASASASAAPPPPATTAQPTTTPKPTAPPPPPAPPPDTSRGKGQRTIGLVVGGVGIVSLGVAGFFSWRAKSKLNDADPYCSGTKCTDQRGVDARSDAVGAADIATVTSLVGGAALITGAVLYFTAPSGSSSQKASTKPQVVAGPNGLWVHGAW